MVLKFLNNKDNIIEIAKINNKEDAFKEMNLYLNKIKFKSYYTIINFVSEKKLIIDYGSHTQIFVIESENNENLIDMFGTKKEDV